MKTSLAFSGLILAVVASCSQVETKSDAWRRAEQSVARQEWESTNGMAWPSTSVLPEIVMVPGMQITARTAKGDITIRAGEDFERFYTWDGETRSVKLWSRKSRWYGSLGIYYPGPGQHWKSNHGITRGVLEEGILWFKTVEDALAWIQRSRLVGAESVYTDSGLLVVFGKVLPRKQLNVGVWQIMVAGEKPRTLPDSRNDLVSVSMSL